LRGLFVDAFNENDSAVFAEFWVSLASLLRSYTGVHGLQKNRHATIEAGEVNIVAGYEEKLLSLKRDGAIVTWTRENGKNGVLELTDHGRLRSPEGEEEMDMAAEAWARELMSGDAAR
jgi:hypothetical protein